MKAAVLLAVLAACGSDGGTSGDDDDGTGILVSFDSTTLRIGEDYDFYAYRVDGSGSHLFATTWTLAEPLATITLDDVKMKATLHGATAGMTKLTVAGKTMLDITVTP